MQQMDGRGRVVESLYGEAAFAQLADDSIKGLWQGAQDTDVGRGRFGLGRGRRLGTVELLVQRRQRYIQRGEQPVEVLSLFGCHRQFHADERAQIDLGREGCLGQLARPDLFGLLRQPAQLLMELTGGFGFPVFALGGPQ